MDAKRPYNFNAGPAILPQSVLEQVQDELMALPGVGLSILEISHRSTDFDAIIDSARNGIRKLYGLNDDFEVLFLQGGASQQFEMAPLNLLHKDDSAQYLITGAWGKKAFAAAQKMQQWTHSSSAALFNGASENFIRIPRSDEYAVSPTARYLHFTSNETIHGVQWQSEPESAGVPLVADASSDFLSRPLDIARYGMIYGGAQKNVGPSGVTIVLVRRDFLYPANDALPVTLDYHTHISKESLYNTPNTFGIYVISLVCNWLQEQGGLAGIARQNAEKAALLYDAIDASEGFYRGHAAPDSRSVMNVPFTLASAELEKEFVNASVKAGFVGLKGHRSVGGLRASIYNALPRKSVEALVDLMREFAQRHG